MDLTWAPIVLQNFPTESIPSPKRERLNCPNCSPCLFWQALPKLSKNENCWALRVPRTVRYFPMFNDRKIFETFVRWHLSNKTNPSTYCWKRGMEPQRLSSKFPFTIQLIYSKCTYLEILYGFMCKSWLHQISLWICVNAATWICSLRLRKLPFDTVNLNPSLKCHYT